MRVASPMQCLLALLCLALAADAGMKSQLLDAGHLRESCKHCTTKRDPKKNDVVVVSCKCPGRAGPASLALRLAPGDNRTTVLHLGQGRLVAALPAPAPAPFASTGATCGTATRLCTAGCFRHATGHCCFGCQGELRVGHCCRSPPTQTPSGWRLLQLDHRAGKGVRMGWWPTIPVMADMLPAIANATPPSTPST